MSAIDDAIDALADALKRALREVRSDDQRKEPQTSQPSDALGYVSLRRAAEHADVSVGWLRREISAGRLRSHRAGRVFRIRLADLDALLAAQPVEKIDLDQRARELAGAGIRQLHGPGGKR